MTQWQLNDERGITLVQMAVLLVVVSLVILPFFQFQKVLKKQEQKTQAFTSVDHVAKALKVYAQANGRYPLPANPELSITDPNSGMEVSLVPDDVLGIPTDSYKCFQSLASPTQTHSTKKVTCSPGARDSYPEVAPEGNNDRVLIGAVPYAVLGLKPEQSIDRFGDKFMYAVTYGLTRLETFADDRGSIRLVTQHRKNGATDYNANSYFSVVDTLMSGYSKGETGQSRVHFVVISHGENRLGALAANGSSMTCGTGKIPVSCSATDSNGHLERENFFPSVNGALNNAVFRLLVNDNDPQTAEEDSNREITKRFLLPGRVSLNANKQLVATPDVFDDSVAFATTIVTGNWVPFAKGGGIYNLYLGSMGGNSAVGIGMVPTGAPEVDGRVQVGGDIVANEIKTQKICINNGAVEKSCWFVSSVNGVDQIGLNGNLPMFELRNSDGKIQPAIRGLQSGESKAQSVPVDDNTRLQLNPDAGGDQPCTGGARGVNIDGSMICL